MEICSSIEQHLPLGWMRIPLSLMHVKEDLQSPLRFFNSLICMKYKDDDLKEVFHGHVLKAMPACHMRRFFSLFLLTQSVDKPGVIPVDPLVTLMLSVWVYHIG